MKVQRNLFTFLLGALVFTTGAFGVSAQTELSIAQLQGPRGITPFENQNVKTTGIVTSVLKKSFYIQTPDSKIDADPNTSEGILVYGENSAAQVAIGDLVEVVGTVIEFKPRTERIFISITEITRPTVKVLGKDNPLPTPIVLTSKELDPKGMPDQLEKFEGMRVRLDATVVAPTGGFSNEKTGAVTSNGVFYVTVSGAPRPFREPGVDRLTAFFDKLPATTPLFDGNPELLRVDSLQQEGTTAIDVPVGATFKGLTGVIDYSRRFYTLIVDANGRPTPENVKGFVAVSAAGPRELTVAAANLENLFDDEVNSSNVEKETTLAKEVFRTKIKKTSLAIRTVLATPDIIGVSEVENLKVLKKLADQINTDAVAAGQPDPKYVPYLEEGNDGRGIDVGYLVKSTKLKVIETIQLGKDEKNTSPAAYPNEKLYDRPPLMIRVEAIDPASAKPLAVTIVVNHFKSYGGINDEKDGKRVQDKRRIQAEWLAKWVDDRQKADATEKIIICGDLNSFQFNDGYNDLVGILKGKSDPNVLSPSKSAYPTGLATLVDFIDQKNRYSYSFDGSAQTLDHIMINKPLRDRLTKFGYARVNADFPDVWAGDPNRPERISDHDAPVLFLSLDEPKPAATPKPTPQ